MPGACKDVLSDLIAKFGRPPIIPRVIPVEAGKIKADWKVAAWVAGGLVFGADGRVALVRHHENRGWDDVWVPPGGMLEEGEPADEGFRREVREETGLEVKDLHITRIFNNAYQEPSGRRYPRSNVTSGCSSASLRATALRLASCSAGATNSDTWRPSSSLSVSPSNRHSAAFTHTILPSRSSSWQAIGASESAFSGLR